MKRIYIAIIILAISVAGGILETVSIRQNSEKYIKYVEDIERKIDNGDVKNAAILCKKADKEFKDLSENYMFYYYAHKNLEEIESNLSSMYAYLKNKEIHDFDATAAITKKKLESIRDTGKVNFKNIL